MWNLKYDTKERIYRTEREIKETIPFTIATKRKKIILVQFSRLVMSDSL